MVRLRQSPDAPSWRRLSGLAPLRPGRAVPTHGSCREPSPEKGNWRLSPGSSRRAAGLGHLCATPCYSQVLDVRPEGWLQLEDEMLDLWRNLTRHREQDDLSQLLVMDATLIAVSQFAAKTSHWSLAGTCGTFYPFLSPGIVSVARSVPKAFLFQSNHAKPLLKELMVELGLPADSHSGQRAASSHHSRTCLDNPLFGAHSSNYSKQILDFGPC